MRHVTNEEHYRRTINALESVQLLATDTEAAGYHRYADRICLLQLSTRDQTYVIDALAVDLAAMRNIFADPAREIVIHDAEYDLRLLLRDHDVRVGRLFDTKLASQLLGEPSIGLAALVGKYLGIRMDKKHQRADWAQRPLPAELLEYAAEDTRHLLELRDRLRDSLAAANRLHWAEEEFALRTSPSIAVEDPEAFMRIKNIRDLTSRQLGALREIYAWRDTTARDRDLAPFRVLSTEVMVAVARSMPRTVQELASANGIDGAGHRHARDLVDAVERARSLKDDELPARRKSVRRPATDPEVESLVDRLKTARDREADELGLDRGFLMPRQQLEEVANAHPSTIEHLRSVPSVRNWQVEAVGGPLLRALR
jgi:ribonuclease D